MIEGEEEKELISNEDSDYDQEEELKEQVGELPPKIEDMREQQSNNSDSDNNDAPTVVIDSSIDEVQQFRDEFNDQISDDT